MGDSVSSALRTIGERRRPFVSNFRRWPIALALFLVSFFARLPFCTNNIFTYDAADYLRAVRRGFWVQFVGSDSMSFPKFLGRYISDPTFRLHPWEPLYAGLDGGALRHFHVPLAFYLPALEQDLVFGTRSQLIVISLISSVTVAAAYLILTSLRVNLWLGAIVSLFLCFSPVLILAGTTLSPHALFSLTAILTVFAYCKWIEAQTRGWLALLLVCGASSVACLELSPLLIATLLIATVMHWWWTSKDPNLLWLRSKQCAWGAVIVAALLFLLWPGGFLRGGYLMSYGTFVDQGLIKNRIYFKNPGLVPDVVRFGHGGLLGVTLVLLLALAVYANIRIRKQVALFAFTLFALLLFAQGMGNGFRNPTYASHPVIAIAMSGALALHALWSVGGHGEKWAARGITGLLTILSVAEASPFLAASPAQVTHDPMRVQAVISELRAEFPAGTTFAVTQDPQAFILNAPEYHFTGTTTTNSSEPRAWIVPEHYYLLVDKEDDGQPHDVPLCSDAGFQRAGFAISCQEIEHRSKELILPVACARNIH